jgi:hypothetical protein
MVAKLNGKMSFKEACDKGFKEVCILEKIF